MILKRREEVSKLRPGEYTQAAKSDVWIHYKCPACGFLTRLSKQYHTVDYDGVVSPNATCPHKTGSGRKCGFSDGIILESWVPEALGQA